LTGQRLSYSVGFALPDNTPELLKLIPERVWAPAYDAHDQVRDGAWVAELTGLLNLKGWPAGMRVIARKQRPRPGAQLPITDVDGHRVTAFATNTTTGRPSTQLADLELRHRRRARCEDRIRVAKDTGLTNLPLHGFDQNRIWCVPGRPGLRDHRLDADAHPGRPRRTPMGTETAAAQTLHRPSSPDPNRPAGLAAHLRTGTLGEPGP